MGIKGPPPRTSVANANQINDWRIYFEFAQILISRERKLYKGDKPFSEDLGSAVCALDSTTIDLCLSLVP